MNDAPHINVNDDADEYRIVVKSQDDIINELTDDLQERLLYESIIDGVESGAAEAIKNNKIAQLPSIGCVRKNPIKTLIKEKHVSLKIARQNMTSTQYKDHVKGVVVDITKDLAKKEKQKLLIKRVRSKNKKQYDKFYIKLGKAYAEMFILSILLLKEVPFNMEVQEHFDRLNNK